MWIVLGTKEKSERVPNGRRFESRCQACGEVAMFYERRATSTVQLYFLDIVDYGSRLVMACGACGTLYATGDAAHAEPDMIAKAKNVASRAVDKVSGVARDLISPGATRSRASESSGRDEDAAEADPLREDDEALEARFRELEKRVRIDTGEK